MSAIAQEFHAEASRWLIPVSGRSYWTVNHDRASLFTGPSRSPKNLSLSATGETLAKRQEVIEADINSITIIKPRDAKPEDRQNVFKIWKIPLVGSAYADIHHPLSKLQWHQVSKSEFMLSPNGADRKFLDSALGRTGERAMGRVGFPQPTRMYLRSSERGVTGLAAYHASTPGHYVVTYTATFWEPGPRQDRTMEVHVLIDGSGSVVDCGTNVADMRTLTSGWDWMPSGSEDGSVALMGGTFYTGVDELAGILVERPVNVMGGDQWWYFVGRREFYATTRSNLQQKVALGVPSPLHQQKVQTRQARAELDRVRAQNYTGTQALAEQLGVVPINDPNRPDLAAMSSFGEDAVEMSREDLEAAFSRLNRARRNANRTRRVIPDQQPSREITSPPKVPEQEAQNTTRWLEFD